MKRKITIIFLLIIKITIIILKPSNNLSVKRKFLEVHRLAKSPFDHSSLAHQRLLATVEYQSPTSFVLLCHYRGLVEGKVE